MRVTADVKISTEKAIRAAARKLFLRHGFDATSTREIAERAKVAVGTLFNYFPSKEALAVAIAAEGFQAGREQAMRRLGRGSDGAASGVQADGEPSTPNRAESLEEDLFTLVACDIRSLAPIRPLIGRVLEAGLSPFAVNAISPDAASIRTDRLEDVVAILVRHGLADATTAPLLHLYWSLYLGVLSFWSADGSPNQEDTWAVLDQGMRMFAGALRPSQSTELVPGTKAELVPGTNATAPVPTPNQRSPELNP